MSDGRLTPDPSAPSYPANPAAARVRPPCAGSLRGVPQLGVQSARISGAAATEARAYVTDPGILAQRDSVRDSPFLFEMEPGSSSRVRSRSTSLRLPSALQRWLHTTALSSPYVLHAEHCNLEDLHAALRHVKEIQRNSFSVYVLMTPEQHTHPCVVPWLRVRPGGTDLPYPLPPAHAHLRCVQFAPAKIHVSQPSAHTPHHATFDVRVGGMQVRALFDSGATCSCMTLDIQQQLGLPMSPTTEPSVSGIGGAAQVAGSLVAPVKIGKMHHEHSFLVLSSPLGAYPVLLGQDFMSATNCSLHFTETHVRLTVGSQPNGQPVASLSRQCARDHVLVVQPQQHTAAAATLGAATSPPAVQTCGEEYVDTWSKYRRLRRHLRRTPAPVFVVTLTSSSADEVAAHVQAVEADAPAAIPPAIQAVIDTHSAADGTLRGDVPHNVTAQGVSMDIHVLPNSRPANVRQYRLTPLEHATLVEKVQDFISRGWIEPSNSPWSSSVLFIPKPNGTLRFCVDYRFLNKVTVKDRGPLPSIPELIDSMQGARVFSALDLCSGFYQIPLNEGSRDYTAFPTPLGQYRWRVMPMGLSNSPAVFQQAMNDVLRSHIVSGYCKVYIDDVLVKSSSVEEHAQHLDAVLSSLSAAKYFCQLPKCQFALSELRYLGFLVDGEGVRPDPKKVETIEKWQPPRKQIAITLTQDADNSPAAKQAAAKAITAAVRSFLGFMTFFARFIPRFAVVAAPLYEQTKDDPPLWSASCDTSWSQLVRCLVTATYAYHPRFDLPFHVYTDASLRGVGGVILQASGAALRPVAFCARKLLDAETRYSTTEQELLAVVYCFKKWRCYLEGSRVVLHTDHEPLTWLQSQRTLNRRQARWLEFLSRFEYVILYIKGDENVVSDALSRRLQLPSGATSLPGDTWPVLPDTRTQTPSAFVLTAHPHAFFLPCDSYFASQLVGMLQPDASGRLRQRTRASARAADSCGEGIAGDSAGELPAAIAARSGAPTPDRRSRSLSRVAVSPGRPRSSPADRRRRRVTFTLPGETLVPDSNAPSSTTLEASEPRRGHGGGSSPPPPLPRGAQDTSVSAGPTHSEGVLRGSRADSLAAQADNLAAHEKLYDDFLSRIRDALLHDAESATDAQRRHLRLREEHGLLWRDNHRLYIPRGDQLRSDVLWWHHDVPWAAHLGIQKTMALLKRQFFWPGLQRDVDEYISSCHSCQINKTDRRRRVPTLSPLVPPESCWRTLGVDLIVSLPRSTAGHDAICVFVCHLSKMVRLVATRTDLSAEGFAKLFMLHVFPHYGFPVNIVSDRGTQWNSDFFKSMCQQAGVALKLSTAFHPQTNGLVERTNEVVEVLRASE